MGTCPIAIMQGRLSPPIAERMQAFPWSNWQQEFDNAAATGYDAIEWLFDYERHEANPLWTDDGVAEIKRRIDATGVRVLTSCADYFMPHPFFRADAEDRQLSEEILTRLIIQAAKIGVRSILLPVLEEAEIRTPNEKDQLLSHLAGPLDVAADHGIRLGLETELPAEEYLAVIRDGNHPALGAYYDTGNNVAAGNDILEASRVLASQMCGVHVKDRKVGGPSEMLGEGDADFAGFFGILLAAGYDGPVTLQTKFGEDYLGIAGRNQKIIREILTR